MTSAIDSALSGLNAATTRIAVNANNIANQFSDQSVVNGQPAVKPFVPQQVDQISLSNGGVLAQVSNVNPATITVPDTSNPQGNGTVQAPNINQDTQLVQLNIAAYDFKANVKEIKVQENLDKSLLDIKS